MKNIYVVATEDQYMELKDISERLKVLERIGYRVFDFTKLSPGCIVDEELRIEFISADILVYLVSPRLFTSNWVWENEIQILPIDGKEIILLDYGACGWENTKLFHYRENMTISDDAVDKILSLC
jgi:hypothetical protein